VRPDHPVVGVGGIVVHEGKVLLIRRGKEPLRGRWVVPGGTVELGETLEEALVREMKEETDLAVAPVEMLTIFERIQKDDAEVSYHFVIVDYLCRYEGGEARAGSDAEALAWARRDELKQYDLPAKAFEVIEAAFERVEVLARQGAAG
jgi:mutator protein MutT